VGPTPLRGSAHPGFADRVARVLRIAQEYRKKVFSNLKFDVGQVVVRKDLRASRSQERRE
jgi:hypothetical protein